MQYCGSWAWIVDGKLTPFLCGHRACSRASCRKLYHWRRVRLLSALVDEYGLVRFFTLTLDPSAVPVGVDPWRHVVDVWSRARKRLRRIDREFRFVAVLERHKARDCPHIHGFTNLWLEQSRWSDLWGASGGGRVAWVSRVDTGAEDYVSKQLNVAKYVGKEQLTSVPCRERLRTLWRSKGLKAKFELDKGSDCDIIREHCFDDEGHLTWRGKQLERRNNEQEEQER